LRSGYAGRLVAAVGAGLLLTASLPPWGWWPLGIAAVAVLYWALTGAGWRERLAVGMAAGLSLYGPGLWWATEFHAAGWVALVVLEALLLACALAVVPGTRGGRVVALALPAALVLAEALRGRWPFGGLPLAGLDLGQVGGPLLPAARLGGHLLLTAVAALAGVGLAEVVRGVRRRGSVAAGAVALALAAAVGALGAAVPDGSLRGEVRVAAVQGGGPRGVRAVASDPRQVFERHLAASRWVLERPGPAPTLVLWPEDVVDLERPLEGSLEEMALAALARDLGATLVAGVVEDLPGRRFRNAAVAWDPQGRQVDRYDKVHRVPFGEYVPYRSLFDRLADLSAVPADAIPGRGPGVLESSVGRLGVVISYEVFFADRARAAAAAGGRLLLVPTNASSYTTAQVPSQELATARLRAVETGRWVVQAAPTGYSAVVDQRGRVVAAGPLGDAAVLTRAVQLRSGRTPAVRLGDWPVVLAAAGVLAAASVRRRKLESYCGKFVALRPRIG
jgi:apolipoprotein N-acyltransferase